MHRRWQQQRAPFCAPQWVFTFNSAVPRNKTTAQQWIRRLRSLVLSVASLTRSLVLSVASLTHVLLVQVMRRHCGRWRHRVEHFAFTPSQHSVLQGGRILNPTMIAYPPPQGHIDQCRIIILFWTRIIITEPSLPLPTGR
jgi:hypothetical protein